MLSRSTELAAAMGFRSHNTRLQTQMKTVSEEIATGKKSDMVKAAGGDLGYLFSIERTISSLETRVQSASISSAKANATQMTLDHIQTDIVSLGVQMLSAVQRDDFQSMEILSAEVLLEAKSAISALSSKYAQHHLFSGAALDSPTFAGIEVLVLDIETLISTAVDLPSLISDIDNYFYSAGGGFETNFYLGSSTAPPGLILPGGSTLDYSTSGDAKEIRKLFRSLALSGIAAQSSNILATQNRTELLEAGALSLISAGESLVLLQGNIGNAQAQIERVQAENSAQLAMYELERVSIIAADPFESATEFEALRGQIESVYTMTARLSGLSLANYLR